VVKLNRPGLNVKGADDELTGCIERHFDFAGIGIDDKGPMLGERG
jgi:hypothetical protein